MKEQIGEWQANYEKEFSLCFGIEEGQGGIFAIPLGRFMELCEADGHNGRDNGDSIRVLIGDGVYRWTGLDMCFCSQFYATQFNGVWWLGATHYFERPASPMGEEAKFQQTFRKYRICLELLDTMFQVRGNIVIPIGNFNADNFTEATVKPLRGTGPTQILKLQRGEFVEELLTKSGFLFVHLQALPL